MKELRVLGLYVSERKDLASKVQETLTKYGCNIKTRLGLHNSAEDSCSSCGLIILELIGDLEEALKLENELLKFEGIQVKKMVFKT